jgi:hypothetical protein
MLEFSSGCGAHFPTSNLGYGAELFSILVFAIQFLRALFPSPEIENAGQNGILTEPSLD